MRKAIFILTTAVLMAACGTSSSPTAPVSNLKPGPPVFDPWTPPPQPLVR